MELNYKNIKEILDGDLCASAIGEDGTRILLEWHRLSDFVPPDAGWEWADYHEPYEDEEVYTARWETKPHWDVEHIYHEDGTVEELFHWKEEGE